MTVTKPIPLVKPPSSVDQKSALSRLSKRELEEVNAAPTHYPQQDHNTADAQSPSDRTSEDSSQKLVSQKSSSALPSDSLDNTKKSEEQQFKNSVTGQDKKNLLTSKLFYYEKEEPVDDSNSDSDQSNDGLRHDLDHLPPASSLAGGVTALLSHIKSLFQPYRPSASLDDDESIVPTTAATVTVLKESRDTMLLNSKLRPLSDDIQADVAQVDVAQVDVAKVDVAQVDVAQVDVAQIDVAQIDGSAISNVSQVKEPLLPQQAGGQREILKIKNLASDSSTLVDAVALMTQGGARVSNDIEHDESEDQLDIDQQTDLPQAPVKSLISSSTDSDTIATAKQFLVSDEKIASVVDADLLKSPTFIANLNPVPQDKSADILVGTIDHNELVQKAALVLPENQLSTSELVLPASDSVSINNTTKKEDEGTLLSRLGVAVESVLPSLNKKVATDHVIPTLVESQDGINALQNTTVFSASLKESLLDDDGVTSGLDLEEKLDDVSSHDQKVESGSVRNLEVRGKVSTAQDAGDDTDFNGTQHERTHEVTHKIAESDENNATMVKPGIARTEIAPVTGSAGSSGADLSDPVAAALRVTHLLDELTAAVSRLRLDSSDGKEMTIQLRRDVLPETNIHIVSTTKQMEVSFLTSNAASNLLLNTHLTTLQNHLNSLCPGQVVNVQTQLTPSAGSSQMGSEQERSHDDLASFDQGNRGNSNNDDDTL